MPRVHDDELEIEEPLVRRLLEEQFPEWAALPLERAGDGTVNVIYRLGDALSVRLPRRDGPVAEDDREQRVLETFAGRLPVAVPRVVGRGRPGAQYPWYWSVHSWLDGELPADDLALDDVAGLVASLRGVDTAGAPEPGGGRGRPLRNRDRSVRDALDRVDA
jgi:aminoglycoside phosphotransferase (APT) family kinase protein